MNLPSGRFPLLPRKRNTDKSDYGHTLILAGSRNMTGAAILTARAALVSGSGLVTLGMPAGLQNRLVKLPPEIMTLGLPKTSSGAVSGRAFPPVMTFIRKRRITALAAGPGLSRDPQAQGLVRRLVDRAPVPVVLDADGLNSFEKKAALLKKHAAALVLTPHERELERIFGTKCPKTPAARRALAKKISKFYDGVLVLKGYRTLVAAGDKLYENRTGNPGMAKGGSGDVLTGIVASFISQGLASFWAAAWAVYFHGLAGDLACRRRGELSMTPSDILEYLPAAFRRHG